MSPKHPCKDCKNMISAKATRCKKCFGLSNRKENNPSWKGGLPKCLKCGKQLQSYGAKRCYGCNTKNNHKIGIYSYKHYGVGFPNCIDCGKKLGHYNSTRCRKCFGIKNGIHQQGENNPNYIHGQGRGKYSLEFRPGLKQEIRERDNFTCKCCGLKELNNKRGNKQINLTVHHIDYNKENCKKKNLVSVCIGCNSKVNFNRDYWFAYFTYIMENFLNG